MPAALLSRQLWPHFRQLLINRRIRSRSRRTPRAQLHVRKSSFVFIPQLCSLSKPLVLESLRWAFDRWLRALSLCYFLLTFAPRPPVFSLVSSLAPRREPCWNCWSSPCISSGVLCPPLLVKVLPESVVLSPPDYVFFLLWGAALVLASGNWTLIPKPQSGPHVTECSTIVGLTVSCWNVLCAYSPPPQGASSKMDAKPMSLAKSDYQQP